MPGTPAFESDSTGGRGVSALEPVDGVPDDGPRFRLADTGPRAIGVAFDAVVRAPLMADAAAHNIAARFLDLWTSGGSPTLSLTATTLTVGNVVALEMADGDHGWILPAFMAGLRRFRPRPTLRAAQLRSFCEELHALRPEAALIEHFRDWLWGDGAEGFEIVVQSNLMEAADAAALEDAARTLRFARPRHLSVESMAADHRVLSRRDLDDAAGHAAMAAPFESLVDAGAGAAAPLPEEEMRQLADASDDGFLWANALVDGAMAVPALRATIPPERLGRHASLLLGNQVDARSLGFVARLGDLADGYGRLVARSLDDTELGKAIATRIDPTPEAALAIGRLATIAPPRLLAGLALGLVDRAVDPTMQPWVLAVVRELTVERLHEAVNLASLQPEQLHAYATVITQVEAGSGVLASLMVALPVPVAARLYASLGDDLALALLEPAMQLAQRHEPAALAALLDRVSALREPRAFTALGKLLRATRDKPWPPRLLARVVSAIALRIELQHDVLVPVVRDDTYPPLVRLGALRAITDRDTVAEAVAWRFGELLDPPEVRTRLKEVRAEMREPS